MAATGRQFEYYNYEPTRDNQEINSLLQRLAFRVPDTAKHFEDGRNQQPQMKSASTEPNKI